MVRTSFLNFLIEEFSAGSPGFGLLSILLRQAPKQDQKKQQNQLKESSWGLALAGTLMIRVSDLPRKSSVIVARTLARSFQDSLGPNRMLKAVFESDFSGSLLSDPLEILNQMEIEHPLVEVFREHCFAQKESFGTVESRHFFFKSSFASL
jgi:hypothetical protein